MEPAEYELMCETVDDELRAEGRKAGLLHAAVMAEEMAAHWRFSSGEDTAISGQLGALAKRLRAEAGEEK